MNPSPVHPYPLVAPLPSTPELARLMEPPVEPVSCSGLRDASEHDIFFKARLAGATTLTKAIKLLSESETWVEIRQSSHGN